MKAELFIHGPRHAFFGNEEDERYFSLFDDSRVSDKIRYSVEMRRSSDGNVYAYYNYCRYSNVRDIDGRSGSYIGVSLRLDSYYKNLRNIFSTLDAVFRSRVCGLLVRKDSAGYQYMVADFRNCEREISSEIEAPLGAMLQGVISSQDILPIDSSFSTGGQTIVRGLDDNRLTEECLRDIRRTGRLLFTSSLEIDSLRKVREDAEREKSEISSSWEKRFLFEREEASKAQDSLKSEISSLKEEKYSLSEKISSLEENNRSLSTRLDGEKKRASELEEKVSLLESSLSGMESLKSKLKRQEEEISSLKDSVARLKKSRSSHEGKTPVSDDGEEGKGVKIDHVSSKYPKKELGEGLKIGLFAFFLLASFALGAFVGKSPLLDKMLQKGSEDSSSQVEKQLTGNPDATAPEVESEDSETRCMLWPNSLSSRLYPGSESGSDPDAVISAEVGERAEFRLKEPSFPVEEFIWEVKNISSGESLFDTTSVLHHSFIPEKGAEYAVRVFVNDTLIVQKIFKTDN